MFGVAHCIRHGAAEMAVRRLSDRLLIVGGGRGELSLAKSPKGRINERMLMLN